MRFNKPIQVRRRRRVESPTVWSPLLVNFDGLVVGDDKLIWMAPTDCVIGAVLANASCGGILIPILDGAPLTNQLGVKQGDTTVELGLTMLSGSKLSIQVKYVDGDMLNLSIAMLIKI